MHAHNKNLATGGPEVALGMRLMEPVAEVGLTRALKDAATRGRHPNTFVTSHARHLATLRVEPIAQTLSKHERRRAKIRSVLILAGAARK